MRMKPVGLILFMILVLGTALAAAAQVAPVRTMKIKVTAEQANLREKPDIGSGIVQQIPEGTVLEADRKEGEWFFVRYTLEDGGVIGGWIHESLVEIVEGAVAPVETRPAARPEEPPATPRERRPGRVGIGRIEKPEFRTGSFPLEAAFSGGVATVAPRDLNDGARGRPGGLAENEQRGRGRSSGGTTAAPVFRPFPQLSLWFLLPGPGSGYLSAAWHFSKPSCSCRPLSEDQPGSCRPPGRHVCHAPNPGDRRTHGRD